MLIKAVATLRGRNVEEHQDWLVERSREGKALEELQDHSGWEHIDALLYTNQQRCQQSTTLPAVPVTKTASSGSIIAVPDVFSQQGGGNSYRGHD
ncbi:hypothetical protein [Bradyrhizobium symbiodeficiens]|uniref:hypothetical protein n=1 Tax=Bradyrhizobium symbiodeficiens TaxID=1404367 RepID=UPI0011E4D37E|nr:hypothetical protein [Bradyrhizobium symbiodeficiens]